MNITVICVGKIKEDFFRDAISEYSKRLGRYCKLKIIEVPDEMTPQDVSENAERIIKEKEGERILKAIQDNMFVYALAIEGKSMDSVAFSEEINRKGIEGQSNIAFVIGGSLGLSEQVYQRADKQISFSKMTFPHQLMRVILLEQIYRGYRIMNHEPYHK